MNWILKLFCRHDWRSFSKVKREWVEKELMKGTEYWIHPTIVNTEYEQITEVLVCEKCGKIKIIDY